MPTSVSTYELLAWAIENRVRLCCDYQGYPRDVCPIILGRGSGGEEAVLVYQIGGATSKGPIRGSAWKCFRVSGLNDIEIAQGEWRAGASHKSSQSCVQDVDYDVNRASPYRPRRSLGNLRRETL